MSEQIWPQGSGGTLATHLIIKLLSQSGVETTVITGTHGPARIHGVSYLFHPILSYWDKFRLWTCLGQPSVQNWFRDIFVGTDIVYIPRYCYPLVPLARDLGKKVVVHLHDYQPISCNAAVFNDLGRKSFFDSLKEEVLFELSEHASISRALLSTLSSPVHRLGRSFVAEADEILCVSKRQAEIIARKAPELAGRIQVIYNPLPELVVVEKRLSTPSMIYLGGDSHIKGFNIFLKASYELLKQSSDIKFTLTRDFKHASRLLIERLNRKFGRAYNLAGYLKHEQLADLYSSSWALLFPSMWEEPFGYAVVEAMLAGTVPIASNVGGVSEIVKGTFAEGMLFEAGDVDSFVDRIESLIVLSNEQMTEIGFGLREAVMKRFNSEVTKKKLLEAFLS